MGTSAPCGLFCASLPAAFLKSGRIPAKSANNLNTNYPRNPLLSHLAVKPIISEDSIFRFFPERSGILRRLFSDFAPVLLHLLRGEALKDLLHGLAAEVHPLHDDLRTLVSGAVGLGHSLTSLRFLVSVFHHSCGNVPLVFRLSIGTMGNKNFPFSPMTVQSQQGLKYTEEIRKPSVILCAVIDRWSHCNMGKRRLV